MPQTPKSKDTLSPEEIARVAYDAGFKTQTTLSRAVAVALAESSGKIRATHTNSDSSRSIDRGLWQINSKWHPEVSEADAFNPPAAAAAAYRISNGGKSWSAWATWTNGAAAAQMPRATLAAAKVLQNPGSVVIDASWWNPLDWLPSPGDAAEGLSDALMFPAELVKYTAQITEMLLRSAAWVMNPHNWLRVLEVMAGAGAVVLGVKMLADSGVGGPVGGIARGAVKTAKAGTKAIKKAASTTGQAAAAGATGGASVAAKGAAAAAAAKG